MRLFAPVLVLLAGCAAAPIEPPKATIIDAICGLRFVQQTETTTVVRVRCDKVPE